MLSITGGLNNGRIILCRLNLKMCYAGNELGKNFRWNLTILFS